MNADAWERVQELYHAALELPPEQRTEFLSRACVDQQLLDEVESLLVHQGQADALLENPAVDPTSLHTDNIETPQQITHYRILAKVGEGGMGVVWKAQDIELNRPVAIKALSAGKADESRRARFLQEARSVSALNHPNIVAIYDIIHREDETYFVMEFVEGKSLDQLIPEKGMRPKEAVQYAIQVADALSAAHKVGIVHRDLKPPNVMITPSGGVKVLDFGLAKLVKLTSFPTGEATPLTQEGTIVGTANYMSPEQAQGKPVDTRSDIFSFGSVLYEMLTGASPFRRESRLATLSAVIEDEPILPANVQPELAKLIQRCLRKDPERRVQHIGDVKLALQDLLHDWQSEATAGAAKSETARRKWIALAAIGLLAIAGGAAAYLAWGPAGREDSGRIRVIPITSYPGSETAPSFSPDGTQVAFSWGGENRDNNDIFVKLVSGGSPLRLTRDPARDYAPSWSPDGNSIAFFRADKAAGVTKSLMVISPLGGAERKLTEVSSVLVDTEPALSWARDSKSIVFADSAEGQGMPYSLFQISLATSERQRLTVTSPGIYGDVRASLSPDGKYLAFARYPNSSNADLYLLALQTGDAPRRLVSVHQAIESISWTPSGADIISSAGGSIWQYSVRGSSENSIAIAGIDGPATNPTVSSSGRLAYERGYADINIWSLSLDVPHAKPVQAVASTRGDVHPHLSPDGRRLVFASDRSGNREIWRSTSSGGDPVQVTFLGADSHSPKWSPDGKFIAFSSLANTNRDVYIIDSSGGSLRRMTTDSAEEGRPNWSKDGEWLYFYSKRGGPMQIWKMPVKGGAPVQVTTTGGHSEEESPDGKDLFYSFAHEVVHGLYRRPLTGGPETLILKRTLPGWWATSADGIFFAEVEGLGTIMNPPIPIQFWNYRTGKVSPVTVIDKPIFTPVIGLSASFDGKTLAWIQIDHQESDLMLVENLRLK